MILAATPALAGAAAFTSEDLIADFKTTLKDAVADWLENSGAAEDEHGPIGAWDTSKVTDMWWMFREASSFNAPIGAWDTSSVTDMYGAFDGATAFNADIGDWDVSKVVDMRYMFWDATAFNAPIGDWDVSPLKTAVGDWVTSSGAAEDELRPIDEWDVSKVTDMSHLFCVRQDWMDAEYYADNYEDCVLTDDTFNEDIGAWDVSQVTTMVGTFVQRAAAFDAAIGGWDVSQAIGGWDASKVTTMYLTFYGASAFDQDIGAWDVSKVTDLSYAFSGASAFNQRASATGTFVGDGYDMFLNADAFDQCLPTAVGDWVDNSGDAEVEYGPIDEWDVSKVTDMSNLFCVRQGWMDAEYYADNYEDCVLTDDTFNEAIGAWDVSKVTNMRYAFYEAAAFDADIGAWDVSKVTDMEEMFYGAAAFDQDIGAWDTSSVRDMFEMFSAPRLQRSHRRLGRAAFMTAVGEWIEDSSATEAKYGPIQGWDVNFAAACSSDTAKKEARGGSIAIIVPVVVAAVLVVAAVVYLARKRRVARLQPHRQSSVPTIGGEVEA
ncbi:hypothetical protein SO694_00124037 [Aureococcus anophagefferens]|uniref:BspA family leucine-rich repeat surface protein n=1 Tax=Aureococcus anophagefferens TaxID=44056 RepID=A0ABR1G3S7_AURAN